jgi:hypothetical protein
MSLTEIAQKLEAALARLTEERRKLADTRETIAGLEIEIQQLSEAFNAAKASVVSAEPSVLPQ